MHPAVSVIFFTVASGAGFGAVFWLGAGLPVREGFGTSVLLPVLAGGFAVAGLLSSTFHLGHPERAWRALSQWRTSWLSREGVLAIACLCAFGIHTLVWWIAGIRDVFSGLAAAALALATVHATGMIYAQLRTVPLWNRALTPATYLAFSAATGFLLVAGAGGGVAARPAGLVALAMIALAWTLKHFWWNGGQEATLSGRGSDAGTATGLGRLGSVRLLERPHTGENYLTREMVHKIGRKHASKLRRIAWLFGAFLPGLIAALVAAFAAPAALLLAAALAMIAGLLAERWLFFAEAKHAVSLYYD